jgi:hypothetical protein
MAAFDTIEAGFCGFSAQISLRFYFFLGKTESMSTFRPEKLALL